ncbi:MAG: ATPase, partial [Nitrososphaerota archaeon]
ENVSRLEKELGVSIEVEPKLATLGREVEFEVRESGNTLSLVVGEEVGGKVNIYVDNEYLFSATIGRKGVIKISKRSENGRALVKALYAGRRVRLVVTG